MEQKPENTHKKLETGVKSSKGSKHAEDYGSADSQSEDSSSKRSRHSSRKETN